MDGIQGLLLETHIHHLDSTLILMVFIHHSIMDSIDGITVFGRTIHICSHFQTLITETLDGAEDMAAGVETLDMEIILITTTTIMVITTMDGVETSEEVEEEALLNA